MFIPSKGFLKFDEIRMIKDLVGDWRKGVLSDLSAMIALSLIVDPGVPSKEALEWGAKVVANMDKK